MESEKELSDTFNSSVFDNENISSGPSSENANLIRCPTFKQFGEKIKKLEHENFQLKLRIYLHDTKYGKAPPGSAQEIAVSSATLELANEFQALNESKEGLEKRVRELENITKNYEDQLRQKLEHQEEQEAVIFELRSKLDILDREIALNNLKQNEDSNGNGLENNLLGFSLNESDSRNYPCLIPTSSHARDEEAQMQIQELMVEIDNLKQQVHNLTQTIVTKDTETTSLELLLQEKNELTTHLDIENSNLKEKIIKLTDVLKTLGFRITEEEKCHRLTKEKYEDLLNAYTRLSSSAEESRRLESETAHMKKGLQEKQRMLEQMFALLNTRVRQLVGVVETLLDFESRGIWKYHSISSGERQNIFSTLTATQRLIKNFDDILRGELGGEQVQVVDLDAFNSSTSHLLHLPISGTEKPRTVSSAVQCDSFSDELQIRLSGVERENYFLEESKRRLLSEKSVLASRLSELETVMRNMRNANAIEVNQLRRELDERIEIEKSMESRLTEFQRTYNEMLIENRILDEKLKISEEALNSLHKQHAKLLEELKDVHALCPDKENLDKFMKLCTNIEGNRDDASPDLGIESGQEHTGSNSNNTILKQSNQQITQASQEELELLRAANKDLQSKLKQTKIALDKTLDRLKKSHEEKEEVEKAVCRQLHKTHHILKAAKKNLDVPSEPPNKPLPNYL